MTGVQLADRIDRPLAPTTASPLSYYRALISGDKGRWSLVHG